MVGGRFVLLALVACLLALQCAEGGKLKRGNKAEPGDEDWGYIEVRPGAFMFYWLYYSTDAPDPSTLPLVIWLQGGPGSSGCGFGNFEIIGPLDLDLQPRNSSWIHHANILFIDNPVGTGYSYVENLNLLTTTNKEIADDLVTFTKEFYATHPEFTASPLVVFGESYGGKMNIEFVLELDKVIKAGELDANLKAVAIGDGWVSPIDATTTWAPYLWHTGVVDTEGHDNIDRVAQRCRAAVDEGRWDDATQLWSDTEVAVMINSDNVDFYNILYRTSPLFVDEILKIHDHKERAYKMNVQPRDALNDLMNGPIRDKLIVTTPNLAIWDNQGGNVFNTLWTDFMKPATHIVEDLLTNTELDVVIYNGQLDLIVDTPGQILWAERLDWPGQANYMAANRDSVTVNGFVEGYLKESGHLSFWWIDRAGHMVPADNPNMGIKMLRQVCGLPAVN